MFSLNDFTEPAKKINPEPPKRVRPKTAQIATQKLKQSYNKASEVDIKKNINSLSEYSTLQPAVVKVAQPIIV